MSMKGGNLDSMSLAGKAQEIGDFLNSVVISGWKNQEFSDTTRDGKLFCSGIPLNSFYLRRYVFDVLSSSSAVSSSAS